jgi:hypothetical protein
LENYLKQMSISTSIDDFEKRAESDFNRMFYTSQRREIGICANIANVPIYSSTMDGEIVVSTLNTIKSPNTTAFYYFMRSISSSNEKYSHSFIPIKGIPDNNKFKNNPFKKEDHARYLYEPSASKTFFQFSVQTDGSFIPTQSSKNAWDGQAREPETPAKNPETPKPPVILTQQNIIGEIRAAYKKKLAENGRDATKPLTIYERSEIVRIASYGDRRFLVGLGPQNNNRTISGTSFQAALSSIYALPPKQFVDEKNNTTNQTGYSNDEAAIFCKYPTQSKKLMKEKNSAAN